MRDEFSKLDTDKSGYITKDEMVTVISSEFQGDKVSVLQYVFVCIKTISFHSRWRRPRKLLTSWMLTKMEKFLTPSSSSL